MGRLKKENGLARLLRHPARAEPDQMTQTQSASDEIDYLKEQLRVLAAENGRLRARAAAALAREDRAEEVLREREEELLLLRRRSFHWYLSALTRPFRRLLGAKG